MTVLSESPFITVVMPVRNEARFIADTLGQLLRQDYPRDRFEILVADGMSDDGTREIVARIAGEDDRVRLLDNPKKRSSAGRNVGFKAGQGDYFVVVDGHCHIPDEQFLRNIAECFEKSGADCLGRPQPLDPPGLTLFQQSVALARASRLGHGGDSLIYGDFEGFASPVSNGAAYRREVFEKVGYVDEAFDACEDVEFNYRVEQAGLKTYTSPKLTVRYYPRENLSTLVGQMRRYGRGRTRLYRKYPALLSPSALVPACFAGGVAAFVALLGLDLAFGLSVYLTFVFFVLGLGLLAYAALVGMSTVRICRESGWDHVWRVPFVFLAVHGGLGLGMWEEIFRGLTLQKALIGQPHDNNPLKIAYIIDTIESPTAGTEKQLLMLIKHLDRSRFSPTLFVLKSSPWLESEFNLCPLEVISFQSFLSLGSYAEFLRFSRLLRRSRFDCIQTHFVDSNIVGIVAAKLAGVPSIISSRRDQGYWHTPAKLRVFKILNRFVDCFVSNCLATADWAVKAEGISRKKIRVIYNGLELQDFTAISNNQKKHIRDEIGLTQNVSAVCTVANLRPVKRVDLFLKAAAMLANGNKEVVFVIVGDGEQRLELERFAQKLGIAKKTFFLGRRSDIPKIIGACDVGVLSSDSESFSNAMMEYMAAGLAVVATDVGGCREALGESPAGALVPPGDVDGLAEALARMLADENVLAYARSQHPLRVQDLFSRDRYIASYSDLYRDLLGVRGEGAA